MNRARVLTGVTVGSLVFGFLAFVAPSIAADNGIQVPTLGEHNALADRVTLLEQDNQALDGRVTDLEGRVTTLEKAQATPTPDPTPTAEAEPASTVFGACVANGNTLASTVTKWGQGVTVRQFFTGIGTASDPNWPDVPDGTVVHRSYKPSTSVTDAEIRALIQAAADDTVPGQASKHVITFWHESDNDGLTGAALAARIKLMNRLYDINQDMGAPVLVAHVVTGWFMSGSNSDGVKDAWRGVKADLIGVDFDGIHDSHTSAPADGEYRSNTGNTQLEYDDEIVETLQWIADDPTRTYQGWTVPEFGTTQAPWDTTGEFLTRWIEEQVGFMQAAATPPLLVQYFDYSMSGRDYTLRPGSPEFAYWSDLVAKSAA